MEWNEPKWNKVLTTSYEINLTSYEIRLSLPMVFQRLYTIDSEPVETLIFIGSTM